MGLQAKKRRPKKANGTTGPASLFMNDPGFYEVPPDAYSVPGDNSPNSFDSRYWGGVPGQAIAGFSPNRFTLPNSPRTRVSPLQFHECSSLFIGTHDETLPVAMCVALFPMCSHSIASGMADRTRLATQSGTRNSTAAHTMP